MAARAHWLGLALALAVAVDARAAVDGGDSGWSLPPGIDLLVVEPNEGGSSGGHIAIRFRSEVFHFQNEDGGLLRLRRVDAGAFDRTYALTENRSIAVIRIGASPETIELLRDAFQERLLSQERALAELAELERERDLLEALLARSIAAASDGDAALPEDGAGRGHVVEAAGLFFADGSSGRQRGSSAAFPVRSSDAVSARHEGAVALPAVAPAEALIRLRARIEGTDGRTVLRERAAELRADLAASDLDVAPGVFGARYLEAFAGWVALDILERGQAPAATALRSLPYDGTPLDERFRHRLASFADRLEGDLAHLAASRRPGFGPALMVGMARLVALRESVAAGRLVVVDAYPDAGPRLDRDAVARQRHLLPALREEGRDDLVAEVERFAASEGMREAEWTRVETAANRLLEIDGALASGRELRTSESELLVPSRRGTPTGIVDVRVAPEALARSLGRTGQLARDRRREVWQRHGYDLLSRNCSTEIFRVVDEALGSASSIALLGGHVAPSDPLVVVPALAQALAAERYRLVAAWDVPSHRATRLAADVRHDGTLRTWLRESNRLSSAIHRGQGDRDSSFLFFVDGPTPLRPVLGTVNLGFAVVTTLASLATLPFDGGRGVSRGVRGVAFSIPEIGFFGLRRGTFDHVDRKARADVEALEPADVRMR